MIKASVAIVILLVLSGCSGLHDWLNDEPAFLQKDPEAEQERRGFGADLYEVEYAEYQRVKRESEEARRQSEKEMFGFGF